MQVLMGHFFMFMIVVVAVLTVNMDMCVGVRMLVGMDSISMTVLVGMCVVMLMGMLQFNGIFNHKVGADNHYKQSNIELDCRSFSQYQHTECNTKERGDRVVGTCFCCSQILLSHNIEIDA